MKSKLGKFYSEKFDHLQQLTFTYPFFISLKKFVGILCYRLYELINRSDTLKSGRSVVSSKANLFAKPFVSTMLLLSLSSSTMRCPLVFTNIKPSYFPATGTFQREPHSQFKSCFALVYLTLWVTASW